MRGLLITWALVAASLLAPIHVAHSEAESEPALTERDQFRDLSAAGRHAEALALAEQMVARAESGITVGQDLPDALCDLGAARLRLGDFAGAEYSYLRALALLQQSQSVASLRFLAPYAGLAAIYAAQNRHPLAIDFYRHALAVFRRTQGLFDPAQGNLLEALATSLLAIGDLPTAEAERRYLVQIAARNYEVGDPRLHQALLQFARWHESVDNFVAARLVYERMLGHAETEGGHDNPDAFEALLGIGRTYRMQSVAEIEPVPDPQPTINQVSQYPLPGLITPKRRDFNVPKMNREGYLALRKALRSVEEQDDPPPGLMGRVLTELGDWFMSGRQPVAAMRYYKRAAANYGALPDAGAGNPLEIPRLVDYRPPKAAVKYRFLPPGRSVGREARFALTVGEDGETRYVVLLSSTMNSMQTFQMSQAVASAIYSPRFDNGTPVATTGVEFTAQWFELRASEATETGNDPATGNPPGDQPKRSD